MILLPQVHNIARRGDSPLLDRDKLLRSIFRISELLTAPSNLDEVLSKTLDELVEAIGFERGVISLFDKTKHYQYTKVVKNFSVEERQRAFAKPLDVQKIDCLAAKATKSGQLIAIEDMATDPRVTD